MLRAAVVVRRTEAVFHPPLISVIHSSTAFLPSEKKGIVRGLKVDYRNTHTRTH